MSTTPDLTFEQKQQNQNFILNDLDKFIIDSRGNFYNTDNYNYIGKEAVSNYREIKKKMIEMIIQNKEDWEMVDGLGYLGSFEKNYREKDSGRVMFSSAFSREENFQIKNTLESENISLNFNSLSEVERSEEISQQETLTEFSRQSSERGGQNQENFYPVRRREVDRTIIKAMASKPFILDDDLDSNLWNGYKNWIDKTWSVEISELENYKNQMLVAIEEAKTEKRSSSRELKTFQTVNNKENEFEKWKWKGEIKELNTYGKQERFRDLERKSSKGKSSNDKSSSISDFPTGWVVSGISLLIAGGLATMLVIRSKQKKKIFR